MRVSERGEREMRVREGGREGRERERERREREKRE